jgi:hypothetical protein
VKEWTMVERDLAVSQSHGHTQQLALRRYRDATNAIILALPRGGFVPRVRNQPAAPSPASWSPENWAHPGMWNG